MPPSAARHDSGGGAHGQCGRLQIRVLPDGWTVKTLDGSLAAHYENTILITEGDAEVLTVTEDGAYV